MIKQIFFKLGYRPSADVDHAYRTGCDYGSETMQNHYERRLEIQRAQHAMIKAELKHIRKVLADHAALQPMTHVIAVGKDVVDLADPDIEMIIIDEASETTSEMVEKILGPINPGSRCKCGLELNGDSLCVVCDF
jgi:hypothetical protein